MENGIFVRETEPTVLPEAERYEKLGRCPVCGEAIYAGERVIALDGRDVMIHEVCAVFREESLMRFLDLLGVDYGVGDAEEMAEDV